MSNDVAMLSGTGFLRLKQILSLIPVSKSTWWNGVKSGRFPKAVKNKRCTFWRIEDIRELIESMGKKTDSLQPAEKSGLI